MFTQKNITIAVDLMGGDKAPWSTVNAVKNVANKFSNVDFILFGDRNKIYDEFILNDPCFDFRHCEKEISASEEVNQYSIKNSKNSSMYEAINSVKIKESDISVSSGNTGMLMALSKMLLKTLPGISRPALCSTVPNRHSFCTMLDMGANLSCTSDNFLEFAIMGYFYHQTISQKKQIKIGILNIGSEEGKGGDELKLSYNKIKNSAMGEHFIGFVEPIDVLNGNVDVVVSDGFTGNIFIKTAEATSKLVMNVAKEGIMKDFSLKIAGALCGKKVKNIMNRIHPNNYNGSMFIGLNGLSLKSHGSADHVGFENAINSAKLLAEQNMLAKIIECLKK